MAQDNPAKKDSLVTKTKTLEVLQGNCDDPSSGCINVSLSYPVIAGGNPQIRRQINEFIYTKLIELFRLQLEPLAPDEPGLKRAVQEFIEEWQSEGGLSNWLVLVDGQVAYQTKRLLVIRLNARIVTDETMPEDRISTMNFDLQSGQLITLPALVSDSLTLKSLALGKLQASYPDIARYYDPKASDVFPLPENFELRSTGIFLWFNEMEAPLGIQGPVSVYLTFEELEGIVRREKFF